MFRRTRCFELVQRLSKLVLVKSRSHLLGLVFLDRPPLDKEFVPPDRVLNEDRSFQASALLVPRCQRDGRQNQTDKGRRPSISSSRPVFQCLFLYWRCISLSALWMTGDSNRELGVERVGEMFQARGVKKIRVAKSRRRPVRNPLRRRQLQYRKTRSYRKYSTEYEKSATKQYISRTFMHQKLSCLDEAAAGLRLLQMRAQSTDFAQSFSGIGESGYRIAFSVAQTPSMSLDERHKQFCSESEKCR